MSISHLFGAVTGAAHSAIEGLAALLTPLAGGLSVALAIVAFTLLVRLALTPLTYLQVRAGRRRSALAPQLTALREKHAKDPMALATETLALQRANGVGPFAGLLPGLVQAPFFMVVYSVARHAPAGAVFGIPLSAHLAAGLPIFAVLLVIAGLVAWRSSRRSAAAGAADQIALLRYLPYLTVLTVAWLPLAAALYLVTSSAWTGLEQAFWARRALAGNS
jgi:YidC/Oxa1 family membrane protein insertase